MDWLFLPPDDLPPARTPLDKMLRLKLEGVAGKYFYESCDRVSQTLLSSCEWSLVSDASALKLIIACPDPEVYWDLIGNLNQIASRLEQFARSAKIRVYPPVGKGGMPFEIGAREISVENN